MSFAHKHHVYPAGKVLRLCRLFASLLVCWTICAGLLGFAISSAADSASFQLDSEPVDASDVELGTSDHFQIEGQTTWKRVPLGSTNFQIVRGADDEASSSSSESSSSSFTSSDSGTSGGSGGNGGNGESGGRNTPSVVIGGVSSSANVQKNAKPILASSVASASVPAALVTEPEISPTQNPIDSSDPSDTPATKDGPESATLVGDDALHPAADTENNERAVLVSVTAGEALIAGRLGMIYRFESIFGSIPAYQNSGNVLRALVSGVRPGFMTIDSILFPFGISRRRKRRTKKLSHSHQI